MEMYQCKNMLSLDLASFAGMTLDKLKCVVIRMGMLEGLDGV